jgi:hypothetical protein
MVRSSGNDRHPPVDWLLTEAVNRAGERDGLLIENIDVDIDAVELPRQRLLEDLEAGNELTPRELWILLESEEVDTAEIQQHIRRLLMEDDRDAPRE